MQYDAMICMDATISMIQSYIDSYRKRYPSIGEYVLEMTKWRNDRWKDTTKFDVPLADSADSEVFTPRPAFLAQAAAMSLEDRFHPLAPAHPPAAPVADSLLVPRLDDALGNFRVTCSKQSRNGGDTSTYPLFNVCEKPVILWWVWVKSK